LLSFDALRLTDLPQTLVVVGPNGGGKTNLLRLPADSHNNKHHARRSNRGTGPDRHALLTARPLMGAKTTLCVTPVRRPLSVLDGLVGEEGEVAIDGPSVDEAHGFLVAYVPEEALAGSEHDRVDHQPQLIGEIVL
jgi:hypothetical protein